MGHHENDLNTISATNQHIPFLFSVSHSVDRQQLLLAITQIHIKFQQAILSVSVTDIVSYILFHRYLSLERVASNDKASY